MKIPRELSLVTDFKTTCKEELIPGVLWVDLFFFFLFLSLPVLALHTSSWANPFKGRYLPTDPGDGEGQGGLACCSPRGHKESDRTERLQLAYREHHPIFGLREEGRLLFIPELWGPLSHLWTLASG